MINGHPISFLTTLLWIPFWIAITYFSTWIPNANPNDGDNYGAAFILLFLLCVYPIFIGVACAFGIERKNNQNKDS
ncbi:hypothetical protein P343_08650 [Sporolactobacillus laevolacticus DSM 442]|uniref:Uncharacterized protein n=1 Tax=Sporolactobacillus laevolacticus DSM 442 TaxID=1395513 RepID=V6IXV9_9BACL|nr:hypothetical protein P343_08650 [Sporolactobacillus laevolacticus DSM 442]